jgi:undecaprenyl-diphosphatase
VIELLSTIDRAIFLLINRTLANPFGDLLWPILTDYDRLWAFRILLLAGWLFLLVKGGRRGRIAALLLVVLIAISDQFSSSVVKNLVGRARPCHIVDGIPIVPEVRLLVGCGSGKSFPSSHAVNNFAAATFLALCFPRWTWAFISWASLVALSRVAVGVHYPSDILGGALIGSALAYLLFTIWKSLDPRSFTAPGVPAARPPAVPHSARGPDA